MASFLLGKLKALAEECEISDTNGPSEGDMSAILPVSLVLDDIAAPLLLYLATHFGNLLCVI